MLFRRLPECSDIIKAPSTSALEYRAINEQNSIFEAMYCQSGIEESTERPQFSGTDYGLNLALARRTDEAVDYLNKLIQTDPSYVRTHSYLSDVYLQAGRYEDAIREREKAVTLGGADPVVTAKLTDEVLSAFRSGGPKGFWTKVLELTQEDIKHGKPVGEMVLASIYAQLDDRDKAFDHLNRSVDKNDAGLIDVKVSPRWDKLRNDPRWAEVLKRLNLTP